ncbi:hypothetical protein JW979_15010, partial [bacterium]|nr:hypothetical protein [candidate division CSSED10-310 bacterium]
VCSLISGGFEAIGAGIYGAGIEFSRIMNRLTLDQRRSGFDPVWGILALFQSTLKAYEHFHEVGGGLNLVYIDGSKKSKDQRFVELTDSQTQLSLELVKAFNYDLISVETAYLLLKAVIFEKIDRKSVEKQFIDQSRDKKKLNKLLRGYKLPPYPEPPSQPKTRSPLQKGGKA